MQYGSPSVGGGSKGRGHGLLHLEDILSSNPTVYTDNFITKLDVTNDGIPELIFAGTYSTISGYSTTYWFEDFYLYDPLTKETHPLGNDYRGWRKERLDGFLYSEMDLNQDGLLDLVIKSSPLTVVYGANGQFSSSQIVNPYAGGALELTDYSPRIVDWKEYPSDASGFYSQDIGNSIVNLNDPTLVNQVVWTDFDGDGLPDSFYQDPDFVKYDPFQGVISGVNLFIVVPSSAPDQPWHVETTEGISKVRFGDINGDGFNDLLLDDKLFYGPLIGTLDSNGETIPLEEDDYDAIGFNNIFQVVDINMDGFVDVATRQNNFIKLYFGLPN